jgi:hypothetical protein
VLLKVTQHGHDPSIACHTGRHSCFFQLYWTAAWHGRRTGLERPATIYNTSRPCTHDSLARLAHVIESRKPANGGDPDASYVARLLHKGPDAFLKKIGEEATEVVMAAKDLDRGGDPAASWWARSPTCGSTA